MLCYMRISVAAIGLAVIAPTASGLAQGKTPIHVYVTTNAPSAPRIAFALREQLTQSARYTEAREIGVARAVLQVSVGDVECGRDTTTFVFAVVTTAPSEVFLAATGWQYTSTPAAEIGTDLLAYMDEVLRRQ